MAGSKDDCIGDSILAKLFCSESPVWMLTRLVARFTLDLVGKSPPVPSSILKFRVYLVFFLPLPLTERVDCISLFDFCAIAGDYSSVIIKLQPLV